MKPDGCMRELLLGYLLDALEGDESRQVEEILLTDATWRAELERLRAKLTPLAVDAEQLYQPPQDLAKKTCRFIAWRSEVALSPAAQAEVLACAGHSSWSLADVAVAAGIFFAASLLFFPALSQSRQLAQIQKCQQNVREIVQASHHYSTIHHQEFPFVPPQGPFSVAGMYPVRLFAGGYLRDPYVLVCPGANTASQRGDFRVPSPDEIERVPRHALPALLRIMGGDYAYPFGYQENGQYHAQRDERRPYIALITDSGSCWLTGKPSRNHPGAVGQVVGYEDGHIAMVSGELALAPIYHNDLGEVAAGVNRNDCVLAGSSCRPLGMVLYWKTGEEGGPAVLHLDLHPRPLGSPDR